MSWTLKQNPLQAISTNPQSITVTSTVAGHLGIVLIDYGNASALSFSSITGGTWVLSPSTTAQFLSAASGGCLLAYCLSLTGDSTSISVTLSANPSFGGNLQFFEYSFTGSSINIDNSGGRTQSTATTNPAGIALTLTGSNDVIVQQAVNTASPTAINLGYGNLNTSQASADLENTTNGTAPTWTAASGTGIFNAVAIKEISSGAHLLSSLGAGQ